MDFVEQVKSSVSIVKVIGEHVRLKKLGGSGRYVGLCPFHQEKNPSFSVHATHQFYKCFGCDAKGDVFKFIMEMERVSFFEALKMIAERNGIPMPKRSEYTDPESKLRGALIEMHERAAELFHKNLYAPAGAEARAYLAKRGVTETQANEFGLGLSADSWDSLTRHLPGAPRSPWTSWKKAGWFRGAREGSGYLRPLPRPPHVSIHNESGKVIGFGGRALKSGDEPKI